MSTAVRRRTPTQRATDASRRVAQLLGLEDQKLAGIALMEVAAEQVERSQALHSEIRSTYRELAASTRIRSTSSTVPQQELVPLRRIETHEINIAAPLDPYFLLDLYGPRQLAAALSRYSKKKLLEGVQKVQSRHPDARPRPKSTNAQLVGFIVEHVVGPV